MATEKKTFVETNCKRWHEAIEIIRADESRLDTSSYAYSNEFEYLATAIGGTTIDAAKVKSARDKLEERRRQLSSNAFKTAVATFLTNGDKVYANPDEARAFLKKNGWLPNPAERRRPTTPPKPFQPPRPKPVNIPNPFDKPRPVDIPNPFDKVRPNPRPYERAHKPNIFERIDDFFEIIQIRLDTWLDYITQYAETVFYILGSLAAAAVVILTFFSGHWIVAIIEILICVYIGIYALAIGGALIKVALQGLVHILKLVFRRWWTFLIFLVLAVGVPTATTLYEKYQDKKFKAQVEKALTAVDEERYLDAKEYILSAAKMNKKKSAELKVQADRMAPEAAKKAAALKKSIPQQMKKVQKQKKSETNFVDEIAKLQDQINLLRSNEKPSLSADKFQNQLDELKKKKGL